MDNIKLILAFIGLLVIGIIFLAGVGAILQYFDGGKGKFAKKREAKNSAPTQKKKKYVTFTKRKFDIILYHGIFWVDLSYVLAFMDKEQIAEALSVQAITSIIGAFAAYCIKSAFEKKIGKEKEEYESVSEEAYQ